MDHIPRKFFEAVDQLEELLTPEQKRELVSLPFIISNVREETDFFGLVISTFHLADGNDQLLRDIAKENPRAILNYDFLLEEQIADADNGARLILEKLRHRLCQ